MAKTNVTISQSYLKSILNYDPETGKFIWKYRFDVTKDWNTKYAGKEAGCINKLGYNAISINNKRYLAHRLAWLYLYGKWPPVLVDHKNGYSTKSDNELINLREATKSQNAMNSKVRSDNTSGTKGVYFHRKTNKWYAQITVDSKTICSPMFILREDAVKYRQQLEAKYFGEFNSILL